MYDDYDVYEDYSDERNAGVRDHRMRTGSRVGPLGAAYAAPSAGGRRPAPRPRPAARPRAIDHRTVPAPAYPPPAPGPGYPAPGYPPPGHAPHGYGYDDGWSYGVPPGYGYGYDGYGYYDEGFDVAPWLCDA